MRAAYAPSWSDVSVIMRIARALIAEFGDTVCDATKRALVHTVRKAMMLVERVHHNLIPDRTLDEMAMAQIGRCRISLLVAGTQTLYEHEDIVALKMCIHSGEASYCMGSARVQLTDMSRGRAAGARVPFSVLVDSLDDYWSDIAMVLPGGNGSGDERPTARTAQPTRPAVLATNEARMHMHLVQQALPAPVPPPPQESDDDVDMWEAEAAVAPPPAPPPALAYPFGIGDEDDSDEDERHRRRPTAPPTTVVVADDSDDECDTRMCTTKTVTAAQLDAICSVAATEQRANTLVTAQFTGVNKAGLTKYLGVSGAIFFVDDVGTPLVTFIGRESTMTLYKPDQAHLFYEAMGVVAYAYKNA